MLGLPSNKGRVEMVLEGAAGPNGDVTMRLDYTVLQTSVAFQADNEWDFELEYHGVTATLWLENGGRRTFVVGSPYTFTVPMGADANGDGRVDMFIVFALDSTFTNTWYHRESAGYIYTGGFGRLRALDDSGHILGEHKTGPAFEHACAPKVGSPNAGGLHCYRSLSDDVITFEPTGFSNPELMGGIDLAP